MRVAKWHSRAWRIAGAVALLSLAGLAAAEPAPPPSPDRASPSRIITLCYERADVLPWRSQDGRGLNFDLLDMVARRENIVFEYRAMPWKRCLAELKANEVDGAFAVSYKSDRRSIGEFPGGASPDANKRMHIDRYMLLRRKGSKVGWDGKVLSNVDGAIGAQLGYSVGDQLRSLNVTVDEGSQRSDELARKLIAGRIAAAAVGGSDAVTLMNGPLAAQLELLPKPLAEKPYFLILSRQMVERWPEQSQRIWSAIEQARNSSAYQQLERAAKGKLP
ncbi:substrate-binding periplasmic protein [Massilia endophytica]|uniref:substrate-binding periplasmic protein n=1 Tax=Massilia endophytica TaxID=2899220 RepID=UPI001E40A04A|nr:transporter substrate-binding domain-containing protein [Massilia endophytica]UGQ48015.1 transporter substrate-binding domain-containing protein [Massilia endophytica]